MDSVQAAAERYRHYYIPAERMYDAEVDPRSHADVIIDNRDVANPVLRGTAMFPRRGQVPCRRD
jgi:uridine kinase